MASPATDVVIKVGGSLYDLPDLAQRLLDFLKDLSGRRYVLVAGGGPTVDVVREFDACHRLGEETAHWLALRALSLNAHFLADLLGNGVVITGHEPVPEFEAVPVIADFGLVPIIDAYAFSQADYRVNELLDPVSVLAGELPHRWEATSDALAGRVATVMNAKELVLLKSVSVPEPLDLTQAVRDGHVDHYLSRLLAPTIRVRIVNLRDGSPKR
jgi:aspartokinase-like uncharacterized kinase